MSKKLLTKVLAIATGAVLFAGMFVAGVGTPAKMVAASPSAVEDSVKSALKGCFDATFYAEKYSDVKNAIGTNSDALFKHFINNGMHEGRMVNAKFDPKAYQAAYADVAKYAGGDFCKVYEHYVKYGMKEGRNLTTYDAINAANVAAPAPSSSGSSNNNSSDDKKKVDVGYGITVYLTADQLANNHIEVVKSDYGYGAFLVDNDDATKDVWLAGTDYYFPFEGGKVVQEIDLNGMYVESGMVDGNDIATNYIPTKGSATIITDAYSNGIPSNYIPWAENEAIDWIPDSQEAASDVLYGVTVGFGDYNQKYAQTAVDIWSPDTWFNEHTETETFEHAGAFVIPW